MRRPLLALPLFALLLLAPVAAAATSFHASTSPPPLLLAGMRESVTVTVTLLNTGDDNVTLAVNGSIGEDFTLAPLDNTTLALAPHNATGMSYGAVTFVLNATGAAPANATLNFTVTAVAWEGEAPAQRWTNFSLPVRYETPRPRLEMTPEAATLTLEIGPAEAPDEGRDGVALNLYDLGNVAIREVAFAIVFDPGAPAFNTSLSGLCAGVAGALCAYQVTIVAPAGAPTGNYTPTVIATGRAWEGDAVPLNVTAVTNLSLVVREATPPPPSGANDTAAPTDGTEPAPAPGAIVLALVLVLAVRRR